MTIKAQSNEKKPVVSAQQEAFKSYQAYDESKFIAVKTTAIMACLIKKKR